MSSPGPRGGLPKGGGYKPGDIVRPRYPEHLPKGTGTIKAWESGVWVVEWSDGETSMEPHHYLKPADVVDQLASVADDRESEEGRAE